MHGAAWQAVASGIAWTATYASERYPVHAAPTSAPGAMDVVDHFGEIVKPQHQACPLAISRIVTDVVVHASKVRKGMCGAAWCPLCGVICTVSLCDVDMPLDTQCMHSTQLTSAPRVCFGDRHVRNGYASCLKAVAWTPLFCHAGVHDMLRTRGNLIARAAATWARLVHMKRLRSSTVFQSV